MAKKRILEFLTYAGIGGTQQMFLEFMRHASHDKYIFYVCVLLEHDFLNEECSKLGIETTSLNMRGYWDLTAWWKLYKFAKDKRIDLIRTYGLKAHIIGRIVGKLLGIPANISSVRSTDPWRKWYHTLLDSLTSGLTSLYLSNSEAGRMITHTRERIPLSKIVTIHNGIDIKRFVPCSSQKHDDSHNSYRQTSGISPTAPVIGIVAKLRKMKGHKTIIDALPQIQEKFPDVRCLFVGSKFVNEKWYEAELRRYVQEQNLEHAIIFTGDRKNITEILDVLDVFVLPSLWEGFPTSVLEAMAMKKPVVASAVGGTPELVEPQITGLLIPPDDPVALAEAVLWLLSNPDIATKMGPAGYERVQQSFCIESVVTKTETVYDQLIEQCS